MKTGRQVRLLWRWYPARGFFVDFVLSTRELEGDLSSVMGTHGAWSSGGNSEVASNPPDPDTRSCAPCLPVSSNHSAFFVAFHSTLSWP